MESGGGRRVRESDRLLIKALTDADKETYSYQCPYLALADKLGYLTPEVIKMMPSQFSRLSTREMLLTFGLPNRWAQTIYEMLEDGYTLAEIVTTIKSYD